MHFGVDVPREGNLPREFYFEPTRTHSRALGKANSGVGRIDGVSDGSGVLEPNLLHQEEIFRLFFPQHGRTSNGPTEEDASLQSQA